MSFDYFDDMARDFIYGLDWWIDKFYGEKDSELPSKFVEFLQNDPEYQSDLNKHLERLHDEIQTLIDDEVDRATERICNDYISQDEVDNIKRDLSIPCPVCGNSIENRPCVGLYCWRCGRVFELKES